MSSAAERAAARRAALLNRGGDRLNKLATSARGEDASYLRESRPLAPTLGTFLGEDSVPSTPPRLRTNSGSPAPDMLSPPSPGGVPSRGGSITPDTIRIAEHFRASDMGDPFAGLPPDMQLPPQLVQLLAGGQFGGGAGMTPGENPFAMLLGAQGNGEQAGAGAGMPPGVVQEGPKPKSLWERVLPVLHLVVVVLLVAYTAFSQSFHNTSSEQRSSAWRSLATKRDDESGAAVLPTSFFWIFITIQIMLHSLRIFSRNDGVALPSLLSMVLPFAPPQVRSVVLHGARYYAMLGMLLDDLAVLVFALGAVVWFNSL